MVVNAKLRRQLKRCGASSDEITAAERDGTLTLLAFDKLLMPGTRRYTLAEVAERAGADLEMARRLWRAVGFPDVPADAREFTDADVEALGRLARRIREGAPWAFPGDRAVRQTRAIGAPLARIADVEASGVIEGVEQAKELGLGDAELAAAVIEQFQFDEIAALIDYGHRLQLRAGILRRLALHSTSDTQTLAVGFIDLVGYTALAEELDDDELAELVERFSEVTFDTIAAGGGRVVKTIGDEVMFVADELPAAAEIALKLAAAPLEDRVLPEARVGLAFGPVVARSGDYYGPVVNLASRLTERARPGSVLVSADAHDALAGDPRFAWRELRPRRVRDIGRVALWALEQPSGPESQRARRGS